MLYNLLLWACAHRPPPADAVEITDQIGVEGTRGEPLPLPPTTPVPIPIFAGPAPLPLGMALPWAGEPDTDAERAFAEAEALLSEMSEAQGASNDRESAMAAADSAERVRALLERAAADPLLALPAAARLGDACRMAAVACAGMMPDPAMPVEQQEAFLAERPSLCAPLAEAAIEAYHQASAAEVGDTPWSRHARWALVSMGQGDPG